MNRPHQTTLRHFPCPRCPANRPELEAPCPACAWQPDPPTPESARTSYVDIQEAEAWNEMKEVLRVVYPYATWISIGVGFCGIAQMAQGQGLEVVCGGVLFALGGTSSLLLLRHALRSL